MKALPVLLCSLMACAPALASDLIRPLTESRVLIGDPSLDQPFASSIRSRVMWSESDKGEGFDARFEFMAKGGPVQARLSTDPASAISKGLYAGTLVIGTVAYPATVRIAETCDDNACWKMVDASASTVIDETVSVLISGK